uniref:NADH-ubiquinone oxidoreductase chain 6 n=1 Tax=Glaresis sp. GLA01 TaxID=1205555 RepID=A0A0S2MR68_9SCAR|nr:NADH deshydrogenase subunit 6 [Glaresis sp. GLA01]
MIMPLLLISLLNSISFILLSHPLSMGLLLLIQSITISLIIGFITYNYWFSYILFLIMIGGMLVLFIYMTSVASNEKFSFSKKIMLLSSLITTILIIYSFFSDKILINIETQYFNIKNYDFMLSLNKFNNYPNNMIMLMLIIYLLITLIAVVKITDINMGPLRSSN